MTDKNIGKKHKNGSILSNTERNILKWVQEGKTNEEIGRIVGITKWGVKYHLKNIMSRLDATGRTQAVSQAISQGLLGAVKSYDSGREREVSKKIKVCVIGCGKSYGDIPEMFKDDPFIEIVDAAENTDAIAKGGHTSYKNILAKDVDIIINLSDSDKVSEEIRRLKPHGAEVLEGNTAKFVCKLVEEKRKRLKEREKVLKEHEALYHLGLVIENIGSVNDTCMAILDYAAKLTCTHAGSIVLFDEKSEELVLAASKGFSETFKKIKRWEIRKGGLTAHILNQNAPVVITDIREHPDPNPLLLKEGVRSLMAAPLTIEGRLVGILYVNDFKKRNFRAEDISLFSLLSIYAALTIERVKSIEETRTLSITDGLTGIYNHRFLMEELHKEFQRASRHNHNLSIIMLDVDHFKKYNDDFGHLEGNNVLKNMAKILRRTARTTDTVGRFGGEEFCIIAPEMKKDSAVLFAKRLLIEIRNTSISLHRQITLSGGVAAFPKDGKTPVELIKKADKLLYKAKKNGRNKVCC